MKPMTEQLVPNLSVVIPSGRDFPQSLAEDLITQSKAEDEVIIVNDSPQQKRSWTFEEQTAEHRSYEAPTRGRTDDPIDYPAGSIKIRYSQAGASVARNVGWGSATNDWILFLDDDVSVNADFLSSVRESIQQRPDSDVVGLRVVSPPPETVWERIGEETLTLDRGSTQRTTDGSSIRIQNVWTYGAGAALVVKRTLLSEMNGFKAQLGAGRPYGGTEDTEFIWHASRHGTISYDGTVSVSHSHPQTFEGWRNKLVDYAHCVGHLAGLINSQDAVAYAAGFCNFIRDSIDTSTFTALSDQERTRAREAINTAVTETIRTLNLSREAITIPVGCFTRCHGGTQ